MGFRVLRVLGFNCLGLPGCRGFGVEGLGFSCSSEACGKWTLIRASNNKV